MHNQYIERAANGTLHCWIEVPLKAAVQAAERISRFGILLANHVLGQFGVFNEHEAIVASNPESGRACSLRRCLDSGSIFAVRNAKLGAERFATPFS